MVGLRFPDRTSHLFGLSFSPPVFLKTVYFSLLTSQALMLLDTGRVNICFPPCVGTAGVEPASNNRHRLVLPLNHVPKTETVRIERTSLRAKVFYPRIYFLAPLKLRSQNSPWWIRTTVMQQSKCCALPLGERAKIKKISYFPRRW